MVARCRKVDAVCPHGRSGDRGALDEPAPITAPGSVMAAEI